MLADAEGHIGHPLSHAPLHTRALQPQGRRANPGHQNQNLPLQNRRNSVSRGREEVNQVNPEPTHMHRHHRRHRRNSACHKRGYRPYCQLPSAATQRDPLLRSAEQGGCGICRTTFFLRRISPRSEIGFSLLSGFRGARRPTQRHSRIPSGLPDSIGKIAKAQRAYLAQMGNIFS